MIKAEKNFADKKYGNEWPSHLTELQNLYCPYLKEEEGVDLFSFKKKKKK